MSSASETGPLSALIDRLAAGASVERRDEAFARDLAARLHEAAARIELPAVERMGLEDVVATFYMDRVMRLVVTGQLADGPGEVTITWQEHEFPFVSVALLAAPRAEPYLFATLDFSVRGRRAELLADVRPWEAGTQVIVRARVTLGGREEYRVRAQGVEAVVEPGDLRLL